MASSVGLGVMGGTRLPLIQSSIPRKARFGAVQVRVDGLEKAPITASSPTSVSNLSRTATLEGSGMIAGGATSNPFTTGFRRFISNCGKRNTSADTFKCSAQAGGGGNDGGVGDGGGGAGGGGGGNNGDDDEEEFLNLQQAEEMAAAKGIELPEDFAAAARDGGLRKSVLQQYGIITTGSFLTSFLARTVPAFRDRLIADKLYFFKILAEVTIDSACATVAELRKRGDEFWDEFEFYLSDLVVGLVLDVVLVTLLAPVAIPGREKKVAASGLRRWASKLPGGVFEKSTGGRKFSLQDRVGCYVARGLEYSLAGIVCGVVGQALASGMMIAKRQYYGAKDNDIAVPPVLETGLVWGAFMALSSNTRYQIVAGLERVVDETIARKVPGIAYLTTTVLRFGNNVIGGEQFIDMARWAGVQ